MNFPSLMRAVIGIVITALGGAVIGAVTVEGTKKVINNQRLADIEKLYEKTAQDYCDSKASFEELKAIKAKLEEEVQKARVAKALAEEAAVKTETQQ